MIDYHGLPAATLENEHIRLEYLTSAGPRLVGLSYHGSPNLFADTPDITWDTPHGTFSIRGGHRLWISPEYPEKTYIPDDAGVQARPFPGGVELAGPVQPGSGIRKTVRIELSGPTVQLLHTIVNESPAPITIAPWAITMFRQGGTVILPQPVGNTDPHGLLANRLLVLWPYTRINDPRLVLRDDFILVHAQPALPPAKLGYANTAGWLACWLEGVLFRKTFECLPGVTYPDGGCNAEVYCGDRFVELESLGALVTLAPGQSARHRETWELGASLDAPFLPEALREIIRSQ